MNGIDGAEKIVDNIFNDDAVNRSLGNFCSHLSSPFVYGSTQAQQQQYIISTDAVIRPYSRKGLTLHTSQRRVQLSSSVKSICENCSMYYRVRSTVQVSMPQDCNEATGRNCTDRPPSHLIAPSSCNAPFYSTFLLYSAPEKCFGLLKDRAAGGQHGSMWKWGNLARCQGRCSRGQRRIK
jgi:hypothetical protein